MEVPAKTLREYGYEVDGDMMCWDAEGCPSCSKTGYRGRIGIYEIMTVTEDIRSLVMRGASGDEIKNAAVEGGMRTLRQDGFEKVKAGITSLAEIARVSGL